MAVSLRADTNSQPAPDDRAENAGATVIPNASTASSPSASVAVHVYATLPALVVGVPESVRVDAVKVIPAGGVDGVRW